MAQYVDAGVYQREQMDNVCETEFLHDVGVLLSEI